MTKKWKPKNPRKKVVKAWGFVSKSSGNLATNLDRLGWLYDLRPYNEKPKFVNRLKWKVVPCTITYNPKKGARK